MLQKVPSRMLAIVDSRNCAIAEGAVDGITAETSVPRAEIEVTWCRRPHARLAPAGSPALEAWSEVAVLKRWLRSWVRFDLYVLESTAPLVLEADS